MSPIEPYQNQQNTITPEPPKVEPKNEPPLQVEKPAEVDPKRPQNPVKTEEVRREEEQKRAKIDTERKDQSTQVKEEQRQKDFQDLLENIRREKDKRETSYNPQDFQMNFRRMDTRMCHQPQQQESFRLSLRGFDKDNPFDKFRPNDTTKPLNEEQALLDYIKGLDNKNIKAEPKPEDNQTLAKQLLKSGPDDALQRVGDIARQKNLTSDQRTELVDELSQAFRAQNKIQQANDLLSGDALRRMDEDLQKPNVKPQDRAALSRYYASELAMIDPNAAVGFLAKDAARVEAQLKTKPVNAPENAALHEYAQTARIQAQTIRNAQLLNEAELAEQKATEKFNKIAVNRLTLTPEAGKDFTGLFRDGAKKAIENVRADYTSSNDPRVKDAQSEVDSLYRSHNYQLRAFEKLIGLNSERRVAPFTDKALEKYNNYIRNLGAANNPQEQEKIKDISLVAMQRGTVNRLTNGENPVGNLDFAIARTKVQDDGSLKTSFYTLLETGGVSKLQEINPNANDILVSANAQHLVDGTKPEKIEAVVGVGGNDKAERYAKLSQNYQALTNAEFMRHLTYRGNDYRTLNGTALKNEIGMALGLTPDNVPKTPQDEAALQNGTWNLFSKKQQETIDRIEKKIRTAAHGDANSTRAVNMTVTPVFHDSEETGSLVKMSLFRVQGSDGQAKFVEPVGSDPRIYQSFQDWRDTTKLPPGRLSYFQNGENTAKPDGKPNIVTESDFKNGFWDKAGRVFDHIVVPVVGVAATIGSFFPLTAPVAIPTLAAVSAYGVGRAGMNLYDLYSHDQSLNPFTSSEARSNMIDLGANLAGLRALRAASKVGTLAKELNAAEEAVRTASRTGATFEQFSSLTARADQLRKELQFASQIARARGIFAQYLDTAGMANSTVDLVKNWDKLSGTEKVKAIGQIGFWGGMTAVSARQAGGLKNLYGLNDIRQSVANFKENSARTASALNETLKTLGKDNRYFQPDLPTGQLFADPLLLRTMLAGGRNLLYGTEAVFRGFNKFKTEMVNSQKERFSSTNQELRMELHASKRYRTAAELSGFKPDEVGITRAHDKTPAMMKPEIADLRAKLDTPQAREAFDVMFAERVMDPRSIEQTGAFKKHIEDTYLKTGKFDQQALVADYRTGIANEVQRLKDLRTNFERERQTNPNVEQAVKNNGEDLIMQAYESYQVQKADPNNQLKVKTFGDYLNSLKLPNSVQGNTNSLNQEIPGFANKSLYEQNRAILAKSNPGLSALYEAHLSGKGDPNLTHIMNGVDQVLHGTHPTVEGQFKKPHDGNKRYDNTRSVLSGTINEGIAKSLRNYDDLVNVFRAIEANGGSSIQVRNSNRGSVFEEFYNQHLSANGVNKNNDVRKPSNLPATNGETQPDRYIADRNTLVNLKSLEGGVGADEIRRDLDLVLQGRDQFARQQGEIYDAITKMRQNAGINGTDNVPPLTYSYIHVTNGKTKAIDAARSTFDTISKQAGSAERAKLFKVFYVDDSGVIHQLITRDKSVVIGRTMNGN